MEITFTRQAEKDLTKIEKDKNLKRIVHKLLEVLEKTPYQLPYEKLTGTLKG